jgi:large subunit ribosomal protein L1
MQRGKKYKAEAEKIDSNRVYPIAEAVKLLKENKIAKFDESVEIHVKTNIDPKKGEQQIRGTVVLPHGTGKIKKIAVITSTQAEEAKKAGADIVGGEEIIEKIAKKINFDILVATPEMMPKLAKVAKILGPKGLMPNPKSETVTAKIAETVAALKKGKAAFKNDDTGNIHQVVGKISFTENQLQENIKTFLTNLEKSKPAGLKGKFISGVTICSTMSKGIKINP